MPFFRRLKETAPAFDPTLPWPVTGLAYVAAFMGPLGAGPMVGMLALDWRAVVIGLLMGVAIMFLNGWFGDTFFDPVLARFQSALQKGAPRVLVNIAAFAWAIIWSAISILAPLAILGLSLLDKIR